MTTTAIDAFSNHAAFVINNNHRISSSSSSSSSSGSRISMPIASSSSSSSSLYFQKAPAVAEAIKKSKEEESDDDDNDVDNVMTVEDEDILFGHDELEERHPPFPQRHRSKTRSGNLLEDPSTQLDIDLDYSSTDPLLNKLRTIRDSKLESCPEIWIRLEKVMPNAVAVIDDHLCDDVKVKLTFSEMNTIVNQAALAFRRLGLRKKGQHVSILAENSARWLQVDHGIQRAGGVSAVRGADAPVEELRYIYDHSDSAGIVVLQGPKLLNKLLVKKEEKVEESDSCLGLSNESHGNVKHVILMNREKKTQADLDTIIANDCNNEITISFWDDLLKQEESNVVDSNFDPSLDFPKVQKDDLATIVYTSGTTGRPKGVMLTHGNLLHQSSHRLAPSMPYEEMEPLPNETMVSLLPVWHITERSFEIWMLVRGCKVVYSSIRHFKKDMAIHKPEWLVLVPRVMEKIASGVQDKFTSGSAPVKILSKLFTSTGRIRAVNNKIANGLTVSSKSVDNDYDDDNGEPSAVRKLAAKVLVKSLAPLNLVGDKIVWSKVQDGFGGNLKCIICGGSALSNTLESFYEIAGIPIIVGYGLTECAPLLAFRRLDGNLITGGCVGKPCLDTEIRVVDPKSKATKFTDRPALPMGTVGVVLGRGPQVMKGYYKNSKATKESIDEYGWFDTGDLGRINPLTDDLILTGRVKDTIVLSNGENIEPIPIEDAIMGGTNGLVEQVMVTSDAGQGEDAGRKLIAIVVLNPTELMSNGFITSKEEMKKLQNANELVNDINSSQSDRDVSTRLLQNASEKLRNDASLSKTLVDFVKTSTKGGRFRAFENVNTVYLTLEPFAMSNGQLTQSYKVKRDSVYGRYGSELPR